MLQNRIKSKVLWTTTFMLIVLFLKNEFGFELTHYDTYWEMLLVILIEIGIINDPTRKDGL